VFTRCIQQASEVAQQGSLVTFGIPAKTPETGYGYIEAGASDGTSFVAQSFKEKPDLETAKAYVAAGNYYWNSGMFAFTIDFMKGEMAKYQPEIAAILEDGYDAAVAHFAAMPEISIDYAIAERSQAVRMVPLTCYWNDIGSWDAMYDVLPKDEQGNALRGDILPLGCHDSLIIGRDRLIAGIGLDDLLVVETDDVVLVAKRGESQQVKEVVNRLKKLGRKEAVEHTTVYHAWGTSRIIGRGKGYLMKKVRVLPGKELTLQMHYHRSEHWVFLRGTARVTRGEEQLMLHEGESVFIPQTTKHQLANPGRIPLELIEVQIGTYIGEDDIERY
jgi:mannose-1-phosphate guanylyltransferase/mannose-6-phosphate isomerase